MCFSKSHWQSCFVFNTSKLAGLVLGVAFLSAGPVGAATATTLGETNVAASLVPMPEIAPTNASRWSLAFGIGIIGETTPGDYLRLGFDRLSGPGEGLTYNVTVGYQLHEFNWEVGSRKFQPALELPFMLTLVDQKEGGLTPDLNLGVLVRWRNFPWNRYVRTTFGIGAGLSYSFDDWTADEQRHPDDPDRSNLKFWMPVEITFSLPGHPEHEVFLFIDHQSGGHILDPGGIDAWGFGYRFHF